MKKQNGSLTMFIAFVILPIIFFLFTLSMDLSLYYTRSQRAQKIADEAVLYAHRFLPAQDTARFVLNQYLEQNSASLGRQASPPEINLTSDSISVMYRGLSALTFAGLFNEDSPVALPYNIYSSSRSTPLDVYLAIDTSSYLAPDIFGDEAWGNLGEWPAALFFQNTMHFFKNVAGQEMPVMIDPRIATEQCFNEVFSLQKTAAARIYDYLASFKLNSIGVGIYPVNFVSILDLREVQTAGARKNGVGEANLIHGLGTINQSNAFCAAAAERETFHEPYKFPSSSTKLNLPAICTGTTESITDQSGKNLNDNYAPCMSTKEAIWSSSVIPQDLQDFPGVFEWMSSSLIAASSRGMETGGLIASVPKIGIMLTGDLPRFKGGRFPDAAVVAQLTDKFNQVSNSLSEYGINYTLYQVLYSHRGISDPNWANNVSAYQNFLATYNNQTLSKGSFKIKLFIAENPLTVVDEVISLVLLEKRRVMISDKLL